MSLVLTSSAFVAGGEIPSLYTCEGRDVSPPLSWSGVPDGAKSLALIVDDPDAPDPKAPKMTYVHWVLYNIPPGASGLPEAVSAARLPPGTREGKNDWDRLGYGGPCPPIGRHRYFHKLYALDVELPDLRQPTKAVLLEAMQGLEHPADPQRRPLAVEPAVVGQHAADEGSVEERRHGLPLQREPLTRGHHELLGVGIPRLGPLHHADEHLDAVDRCPGRGLARRHRHRAERFAARTTRSRHAHRIPIGVCT